MKFTLRHLEIFIEVAKYQSISRAAKELCMSQSAASAALQELESRYNMQLFDRSAKRIRLNQLGTIMRQKAENLLAHAKSFEEELTDQEQHQRLKVGASFTIGNYLAFGVVAEFVEQYPNTKVDIAVASTPEIIQKVLNYEVDVGLIEAELHHETLNIQTWMPDNMVAFCAVDHPFAAKTQLTDNDMLNCEWVLREPGSAHRQTFDRASHGLLPKLKIRAELTQNEAIKNAVKAGLGVGCLSEIAIEDEVRSGTLVPLTLENRDMHRYFYIVTHSARELQSAAKKWIEVCL